MIAAATGPHFSSDTGFSSKTSTGITIVSGLGHSNTGTTLRSDRVLPTTPDPSVQLQEEFDNPFYEEVLMKATQDTEDYFQSEYYEEVMY